MATEDWINAFAQGFEPLTVWRSSDGRTWSELGPTSFSEDIPPDRFLMLTSVPGSVVATYIATEPEGDLPVIA